MLKKRFTVEVGAIGLKSLFALADIDRKSVEIEKYGVKLFSFVLTGKDAENFEHVINNTDLVHTETTIEEEV